jgi:hypothetical protein
MQAHPQGEWQQPASTKTYQEHGQQSGRAVERPRSSVLGCLRAIEEANRRVGAQPTLTQAEPRVVIRIDEDASCPETERALAEG